jgi:hypothetical protein
MENINKNTGYAEFESLRWVSDKPIPEVGEVITVNMNRIGKSTITGYFIEHGFIGLLVKPHNPPEWYVRQNGADAIGHVFPAETVEL